MTILMCLLADLIRALLKLLVEACLMLLGLAVRLIYWSVRTYGWGRVTAAGTLIYAGFWLEAQGLGLLVLPLLAAWASAPLLRRLRAGGSWATGRGSWLRLACAHAHPNERPEWEGKALHPAFPRQKQEPEDELERLEEFAAGALPEAGEYAAAQGRQPFDEALLFQAWERVRLRGGGPGPDGLTVERVALDPAAWIRPLAQALASGRYRPGAARVVEVTKKNGGIRRLVILPLLDRVVQQALLLLLVPRFDPRFSPASYGYRPGRSARQAQAAVEQALRKGRVWVVDADVSTFFDSVPHALLFERLAQWLPDVRLRHLVELCVSASSPTPAGPLGHLPGRGLAQGAPLSPLLANLYLHPFDEALLGMGHTLVRYADDFVILCATREQAEQALSCAQRLLGALELRLNPEKTRIVHRDEGFDFLGFTFDREGKRPSRRALQGLEERLAGTPDEASRQRVLAGWRGYFGEVEGYSDIEGARPATAKLRMKAAGIPLRGGDVTPTLPSPDLLERYRSLFLGRPDLYARHWSSRGRSGYVPVHRPLEEAELLAHLRGEVVLGTYLLHPDGSSRALVLDIDGPDLSTRAKAQAREVAGRLFRALEGQGTQPLWFDSGGKGYHLWLCVGQSVQAGALRRWAARWLDGLRPYPAGVAVELFPKQDHIAARALGALIRLPLGRHPETGGFSRWLSPWGDPLDDPWPELRSAKPVAPERLLAVQSGSLLPEPPAMVAPLLGCSLLRALVEKAGQEGDLKHTERLALLYTLGQTGEAGINYLHQVMALCTDYSPQITQRWVERLEAGHPAMRCTTLKEWLKDYLPGVGCECLPHKNPSPADRLRPEAHYRSRPPRPNPALKVPATDTKRDNWETLAKEIFGERLAKGDLPLEAELEAGAGVKAIDRDRQGAAPDEPEGPESDALAGPEEAEKPLENE